MDIFDDCFRQTYEHSLRLSDSEEARPFKLCYSDFGYKKDPSSQEEEHVLVYFSPLLGSRSVFITKDELAKQHKVRVIGFDKPGMGGTDAVRSEDLLDVCRSKYIIPMKHELVLTGRQIVLLVS